MLHDIGAWGLMAASPDAYDSVFRQGSRNCLEKLGAEECMMGIDHCKAGSWLVKSWGLPDEFAEAAADAETIQGPTPPVTALVTTACRWAGALGLPAGHAERFSVRDAIRAAPPALAPDLKAASAAIAERSRVKLMDYAREFDADTHRLFAKL
jgi:HD-like signal output (HDOD) protein